MRKTWTIVLVALLALCAFQPATANAATRRVSALTLLGRISTRSESGAAYARAKFGGWKTIHDCSTRARVLIAESTKKVKKNSHCTVKTGRWVSKYDGKVVTKAAQLDIDHLVPLKEAWVSGAKKWSAAKRKNFANDTGYGNSLIAVTLHENRSKGDQEPDQWMPNKWGCGYVANWVAVKYRWKLTVDNRERKFLKSKLKHCKASSRLVTKPKVIIGEVSR